jgi:hypothetical protein
MSESYVWDDVEKRWKSSREIELENLKQKIIQELLDQLSNNYVISITIDTTKDQGQGQIKKVK